MKKFGLTGVLMIMAVLLSGCGRNEARPLHVEDGKIVEIGRASCRERVWQLV